LKLGATSESGDVEGALPQLLGKQIKIQCEINPLSNLLQPTTTNIKWTFYVAPNPL